MLVLRHAEVGLLGTDVTALGPRLFLRSGSSLGTRSFQFVAVGLVTLILGLATPTLRLATPILRLVTPILRLATLTLYLVTSVLRLATAVSSVSGPLGSGFALGLAAPFGGPGWFPAHLLGLSLLLCELPRLLQSL